MCPSRCRRHCASIGDRAQLRLATIRIAPRAPGPAPPSALSLHQAIRQHRMRLPDDGDLRDELVAVRLRKNSLGVYRLDHDDSGHDD